MLLFIFSLGTSFCNRILVSIHHMLLFIHRAGRQGPAEESFQYITCYSLSAPDQKTWKPEARFNTSHVTLYHERKVFTYTRKSVSIHHMLLFIKVVIYNGRSNGSFNTSHVTLYQSLRKYILKLVKSFNTSHVTLYPVRKSFIRSPIVSFNTSHVTLYRTSHLIQWIRYGRFNTSHVTLYRKAALF